MMFLPPLPIPTEEWLQNINKRYRENDIPPEQRPIRAFQEWAAKHGQPYSFARLALSHLGGEAWKVVDRFFCLHTKLGDEQRQPLARAVCFYDGSFYQIDLFIILGGTDPVGEIDPFQCLAENMPGSLLKTFSQDERNVQAYLEHLSNALDSFMCSDAVIRNLNKPLAKEFLGAAETHLDSAVSGLLATPANAQAAGHARLAFETSLKTLAVEKAGLTKSEAIKISHRLDRLFDMKVIHCAHLIPSADFVRIKEAATHSFFPKPDAHYESAIFPHRRLWECYSTAQHAYAAVLRAFGASDSRALQNGRCQAELC